MTTKQFNKEYNTPLTKVWSLETADLLCNSALSDTSTEGFITDEPFSW